MTPTTIRDLVSRGALFVISHSGGKDSQAMMIEVLRTVPRDQILVLHADLGEVEWHGALEHAQQQAEDAGVPFIVAHAFFNDGRPKDFFSKLAHQIDLHHGTKPPFPSLNNRWCTSELKTGPIEREVRTWIKRHNENFHYTGRGRRFNLIVMCDGIRAAESEDRRKRVPFSVHKNLSKAGREAFTWYPIFDLSTAEVFQVIADADQAPHWAYAAGNERLSCVFCIFGSKGDLAHGAKARPELYAKYVELEQRTGYTLHMDRKPLTQLVQEATL